MLKYRDEFIKYGFVCHVVNGIQHPQCVVCSEVLAHETEASYEVAYLIAQAKKPHTIGESLIKPAAVAMSRVMHGDKAAAELTQVPLSDGTVSRRISEMAQDIKTQLIDAVKEGKYTLQLDESTDVSHCAQLLVFVRYVFKEKLNEEMLFCTPLEGACTGEDIFNKLDSKLKEEGMSWSECLSVCTDGAGAMLGKKKGLRARVQQVAPHVCFTHCIIHREALACKSLSAELKHVLDTAVKIVNYIKSRPLNTRLFATLCNEMGAEHQGLLLHTEVRWLSRGNVLSRLCELREEVRIFLADQRSPLAEHLSDPDWVARLVYLSSVFGKLNGLNMSLQGENTSILTLNDKVQAFVRKLERWRERAEAGHMDMFTELDDFIEENALSVNIVRASVADHLQSLVDHFKKYFPEETAPERHDWIRSPFTAKTNHLTSDFEDALIELSSDRTLRALFDAKSLDEFWISVRKEYPQLSAAALNTLMPFGSTYLCEKTFSALTYIKNKHRSRLNVEDDLRIAVSKIKPRLDLLCSVHIAHPSH
uniref:HAT C-terminal dimerisation domain-containing protein n=1 Tax=Acanthochromis polyacanthus TaxID=80966 RepID=A0A3Q1G3T1_9TELE